LIDAGEAQGLNVEKPNDELAAAMSQLVQHLEDTALIGRAEKS